MSEVEKSVRDFYDRFGWVKGDGGSGEDRLFRRFSPPYYRYEDKAVDRTVACFSGLSGRLMLAGGGDLPGSHIRIASAFSQITCLDISRLALNIAKNKLGHKVECLLGSILNIPLPDNSFDAILCAHVIFHIDKDLQDKAVYELIRVTKPGGRVVIIYANPDSLASRLIAKKNTLPYIWRFRRRSKSSSEESTSPVDDPPPLYYHCHPLQWWHRFESKCRVSLLPWSVIGNEQEKQLLWFDAMAFVVYRFCSWFERTQPRLAVKWWTYPLIILDKPVEN